MNAEVEIGVKEIPDQLDKQEKVIIVLDELVANLISSLLPIRHPRVENETKDDPVNSNNPKSLCDIADRIRCNNFNIDNINIRLEILLAEIEV